MDSRDEFMFFCNDFARIPFLMFKRELVYVKRFFSLMNLVRSKVTKNIRQNVLRVFSYTHLNIIWYI